MVARDANNAMWYVLRYARDFEPASPPQEPLPVWREDTLFYDDGRCVLELLPTASTKEVRPLLGLAVDASGTTYRADPDSNRVMVRLCDGSERSLVCESGVFIRPIGLSLDLRGRLYVADEGARRVVVLWPGDGQVEAILQHDELLEPVDVIVARNGTVFVADRAGERIMVFGPRFQFCGSFKSRNAEGLPLKPLPIAVLLEKEEQTLLVADANHPRFLRFTLSGTPLADVEPMGRLRASANGDTSLEFRRRLTALMLGRRFEAQGVLFSAALDGGRPGTVWHRIELDADIPPGTSVFIESATSDDVSRLWDPGEWLAPKRNEALIPFSNERPEQLIQSEPGQWLRLRVTLESDRNNTPSVRAIRVLYPRHSYLDLLPRIYRREKESARFLERFLAMFERTFTGIEDRYELFSRQLDFEAAPPDVLAWLACLLDLCFDVSWPLERRRALVGRAIDLYRLRGTVRGIEDYVEIYTGVRPRVIEQFLQRPGSPAFVGRPGSALGLNWQLDSADSFEGGASKFQGVREDSASVEAGMGIAGATRAIAAGLSDAAGPNERLYARYAHQFTVLAYLPNQCAAEVMLPVVKRIVSVTKPAHTASTVMAIYPEARVGIQATVGMDLVLGERFEAGAISLSDESRQATQGVLGVDVFLWPNRGHSPGREGVYLTGPAG